MPFLESQRLSRVFIIARFFKLDDILVLLLHLCEFCVGSVVIKFFVRLLKMLSANLADPAVQQILTCAFAGNCLYETKSASTRHSNCFVVQGYLNLVAKGKCLCRDQSQERDAVQGIKILNSISTG